MPAVTFDADGAVGVITLDRPEVHNAVDDAVMEALEAIVDDVDRRPDLRVLILTGAGRSFCAGGDLKYFARLESREDGRAMSRRMSAVLRRLSDGPRPVIAAVNGNALGGGCELLLACHLRIAAPGARFSFRQAAMGVVTGWGGGVRLLRLLGKSRALRLLLTADVVDAAEARRIGLIDCVAEDPGLMDEAMDLARRIAANAPESIAAFLELARTWESAGGAAAERREAELFEQGWVGEHFRRKVAEWTD
jgi:enoyl-CoA hydratase/carnithine racemase